MATNWNNVLAGINNASDILAILKKILPLLDGKVDSTTIDEVIAQLNKIAADGQVTIEEALETISFLETKIEEKTNAFNDAIEVAAAAGAGANGWNAVLVEYKGMTQYAFNEQQQLLNDITIQKVESVAIMDAIQNPNDGRIVYVQSYYADQDGGGGNFTFNQSKKDVNDGGLIINGWERQSVETITPTMFGGKPNDPTFDNTNAINNAFATGKDVYGKRGDVYYVNGIINSKGQKAIGGWEIYTNRYNLKKVPTEVSEPDNLSVRMLYLESAYDLSELLYIKSLGFNTINHYGYFANNGDIDSKGSIEQLLNNARSAGLRVNIGTENPRAKANLSEFINATKDHPATWGYSVYDEPASRLVLDDQRAINWIYQKTGKSVSEITPEVKSTYRKILTELNLTMQDEKILQLRALTTKQLSFVDLIAEGNPFNQLFSTNYDVAFVDSYSRVWSSGDPLTQDLSKFRFDYGTIKAMTGLDRVIPVISTFTDKGGYYASAADVDRIIEASRTFASINKGSYGAFTWDGYGDSNITGRVRTNSKFQSLVKELNAQPVKTELVTEAYLFGGTPENTKWGIQQLYSKIPTKDPNSTSAYASTNAYPLRLVTGSTDTDRTTLLANADYSGIGFKGSFGSFVTNIKARKYCRFTLEAFDIINPLRGTFSVFTTDDGGYNITKRFEAGLSGNTTLNFNVKTFSPNDHLVFQIQNDGDTTSVYRKFLRGLIVCSDW